MNKNNKIFAFLLFAVLIFSLSCVNAANDTNKDTTINTVKIDNNQSNTITKTDSNANITKNDKNIKTATKTSQVSTYNQLATELTANDVNKTINMKKATYTITKPITINGAPKNIVINGNGAVIDGQNKNSFLTIGTGHNITIKNLVIKNTKATSQSGAIAMTGVSKLRIVGCSFINNQATGKGGALTNRGTTVISSSSFSSNTAAQGGAIWSTGEYGGSIHIETTNFTANKASNTANNDKTAVIYLVSGGKNYITSNTFEKNVGRAIHSYKTNTFITLNTFKNTVLNDPSATIRGAVIDNYEGPVVIAKNTFNNITVSSKQVRGGLLYNEIGTSYFEDNKISSVFVTATAKSDSLNGGTLFNRNSTLTVKNNTFSNTQKGYKIHGGVAYNNIGTLNVTNNTFNTKNTATNEISGGAIYNDKTGSTKSKLYYASNNFKNIQNTGKVNAKDIYNLGTLLGTKVSATQIALTPTTTPTVLKMDETLTISVQIKTTGTIKNARAIFKINGITIKDAMGNTQFVNIVNNKASIKYVIPDGWSAKAFKATAVVFDYKNNRYEKSTYFNLSKTTPHFTVSQTKNTNNRISIKGSLLDAYNHSVKGQNTIAVKIDGATVKNGTKTLYFVIKEGVLDISFNLPSNVKSGKHTIQLVTGARVGYEGTRYNYNVTL